jgi:hypothetical protein
MRLSPAVVADIEWAVLAVTGLIALISLVRAQRAVVVGGVGVVCLVVWLGQHQAQAQTHGGHLHTHSTHPHPHPQLGALYSIPWTFRARQQATTRAFNYLWITRALLQVTCCKGGGVCVCVMVVGRGAAVLRRDLRHL